MTTNIADLIRRVLLIAPLPHTADHNPQHDRSVIVGSNGRVLGWVATMSGDWRAVAELWTSAPVVIKAMTQRIVELEDQNSRYHDALKAIHAYCNDGDWMHEDIIADDGWHIDCHGRYAVEAMAADVLRGPR